LGSGGFGQTFFAEDLHLPGHPQCVVKQLKPQFTDAASLETARRLFDTEAKVLYELGNHPQIPRLLAHFEDNQEFYLAQELIEGHSLSEELILGKPWSEGKVIGFLEDILQVLTFVHEKQVIHRDLKPSNLICRHQDQRIVLIDFGAVKQASTKIVNGQTMPTNLTISIGTQGYMPSEQLSGNPRFSSDIYAVGIMAIQALTGLHPKQILEDPKTGELNWYQFIPQVSQELKTVLDQMVCYDFRSRYRTAGEALEAVKSLPLESENIAPIPVTISQETELVQQQNQPSEATAVNPVTVSNSESNFATVAVSFLTKLESSKFGKIIILLIVFGIGLIIIKNLLFSGSNNVTISNETNVNELLQQGDRLRQEDQYDEAIAIYQQIIETEPTNSNAYWGLCYSLNSIGKAQDGLSACEKALSLNSNYPEAFWSKGAALEQLGDNEGALNAYQKAISLKPNFPEAWNNQGTVLMKLKRYNEAFNAYQKALEINPNSPDILANQAAALWALKKYDEAIASLEKALKIDPDHPNANDLRQQARRQIGR
jgi:eukaryotic-like serine/threonine-protein kinase